MTNVAKLTCWVRKSFVLTLMRPANAPIFPPTTVLSVKVGLIIDPTIRMKRGFDQPDTVNLEKKQIY